MPATEEPPAGDPSTAGAAGAAGGRIRLAGSFRLPVPPDRAFAVVTDAELVAAVVPGVALARWDGTAFAASVRLRVGPLALAGRGAGRFRRRDRRARNAVVEVARHDGLQVGTVTITVRPDGEHSAVAVRADLLAPRAGGRIGRAMVADLGHRMLTRAGAALAADLGGDLDSHLGGDPRGAAPVAAGTGVPAGAGSAVLRLPSLVLPAVTGAATVTAGITVAVCRRVLRPR